MRETASLPPYLDTPQAAEHDKENLAARIAEIPRQLSAAIKEFGRLELPETIGGVSNVVFCGMGGSGIGAAIACDLPPGLARKPISVVRGYELPGYVDHTSLVVCISYSGDTEEVLSCFRMAGARKAMRVVIAGGGTLGREAEAERVPCYRFSYVSQPRDALGYLFAPLLILLVKAGVLTEEEASLSSAISHTERITRGFLPGVPTHENSAKQLAYRVFDHVPFLVSGELMSAVARRWKGQFNEHSKSIAWFDTLPEANHNTVEGFRWPAHVRDELLLIMLTSSFDHERVRLRQKFLTEHLMRDHVGLETIAAEGDDLWTQKLSLVVLGDWVSYYLALLYRTDPEAIPVIKELKSKLSA